MSEYSLMQQYQQQVPTYAPIHCNDDFFKLTSEDTRDRVPPVHVSILCT